MIPLVSLVVLDFCEWLKKRDVFNCSSNTLNMYDLILDKRNNELLVKYAEEYLMGRYSIQQFLHDFIDSKEFSETLDSYNQSNERIYHDYWYDRRFFEAWDFVYSSSFHRAFHDFCCRLREESDDPDNNISEYTPKSLAYRTRKAFLENKYHRDPNISKYIEELKGNMSLELAFLDWLDRNNGKQVDLDKIPVSVFEYLVKKYCNETNQREEDKEKLLNSFKYNANSLAIKSEVALLHNESARLRDLGDIYGRYTDNNVCFRCLFLVYESESDKFNSFIRGKWNELHNVSRNYLDIYYGLNDFGLSGHAIRNKLQMLPQDMPSKLPCLVLWQYDMQDAKAINIKELSTDELVTLIEEIVDLIKSNKNLEEIVSEAVKMTDKVRQEHIDAQRPTIINNYTVGKNTGFVGSAGSGSSITFEKTGSIKEEINTGIDIQYVESIINSFTEVENIYREELIKLIRDANDALKSNDENAKAKCKTDYKSFMKKHGTIVGAIITKLSEIATIATFFGLNAGK